jgi:hypothetical protein
MLFNSLVEGASAFALAALLVHAGFLSWLHGKLRSLRIEMNDILIVRRKLLNISRNGADAAPSGRVSMFIQLWITLLLGVLLVVAAYLGKA